jgi:H+/Cl- antiporter ClcA
MKADNRVRHLLKRIFEQIGNQKLKHSILQNVPFWIASILTGIIAVLYTKLFMGAESIAGYMVHNHKWWLFAASPCMFLLAFFVVKKYAPYAVGSGIPQVMAAIELANPKDDHKVRKLLSIRILIVKITSSLLMALGGGAIGREGPTIQIAGSIFRKVNQWIPDTWPRVSRRNMIMTGAAAGLAAAFNTPLGGIVFAVEELTKTHIRYYRTAILTAVIIAGLTAQYFLGPYLYLGYPDVSNLSSYLFLGVIFIAGVTGLAGSLTGKAMLYVLNWKRNFSGRQAWMYVVACAVIMVAIALVVNVDMLGSGKDIMNTTLFSAEKRVAWYLPLLRITGPVISFTTGVSGGVFAPALSAGASFGAVVAGWFHLSAANTNLLILSGMVGFLTGVTRTPFTSAILVLEMTDRHNVIFHLMLAGIISSVIALAVDRHSLYDHLKLSYLKRLDAEEANEAGNQDIVPAIK